MTHYTWTSFAETEDMELPIEALRTLELRRLTECYYHGWRFVEDRCAGCGLPKSASKRVV